LGGGNQRIGDLAIDHWYAGDIQNGDLRAIVGDAMQERVQELLDALRLNRANQRHYHDTLADRNQARRDFHHRGVLSADRLFLRALF
jgi:hypothetical protein